MKFTATQRRWVYGLALAALPLLVAYGLVDPKVAPLWLGFVLALLNVKDEPPKVSLSLNGEDIARALRGRNRPH